MPGTSSATASSAASSSATAPSSPSPADAALMRQHNLTQVELAQIQAISAVGCVFCRRISFTPTAASSAAASAASSSSASFSSQSQQRCPHCRCPSLIFAANESTLRVLGGGSDRLQSGANPGFLTPPSIALLEAARARLLEVRRATFPLRATSLPEGTPLAYMAKVTSNKDALQASELAGCVFCRSVYPSSQVVGWCDDRQGPTAICAKCSIDAIVPVASEAELTMDWYQWMHQAEQDGWAMD